MGREGSYLVFAVTLRGLMDLLELDAKLWCGVVVCVCVCFRYTYVHTYIMY